MESVGNSLTPAAVSLLASIAEGNLHQFEKLISRHGDLCQFQDTDGNTLLHLICRQGQADMCKLFCEAVADAPLNSQNKVHMHADQFERGVCEYSSTNGGFHLLAVQMHATD